VTIVVVVDVERREESLWRRIGYRIESMSRTSFFPRDVVVAVVMVMMVAVCAFWWIVLPRLLIRNSEKERWRRNVMMECDGSGGSWQRDTSVVHGTIRSRSSSSVSSDARIAMGGKRGFYSFSMSVWDLW
jgi:hypothetical protein